MTGGILRLARKWPESVAVATLRNIDAVGHKKHRSACRRMNQRFLKSKGSLSRLPIKTLLSSLLKILKGYDKRKICYYLPLAITY